MKTAAIIGARSMLGQRLAERLRELGVGIITAGRSGSDEIYFDLGSEDVRVNGRLQADVVFHCAASFASDEGDGLSENFRINTASAPKVATLVEKLSATALIYAGSIFSDSRQSLENYNSYALTKALAEQILSWSLQRQGRRFCSMRFSQLYDTDGLCCRHQPWFGRIVAYASRGQNIRMPRSLGVRNFLHVNDAVEGLLQAAKGEAKGELSIVNPESGSYEQIARIAFEVFGLGGDVVQAPEKLPFREMAFPDGRLAFDILDWRPSLGMTAGLRLIKEAGTATAFGPMDVA